MSLMSDREIALRSTQGYHGPNTPPMIDPFIVHSQKTDAEGNPIASYGCTSYGYDIRCAPKFKIFTNQPTEGTGVIDYKNLREESFITIEEDSVIIPPNAFVLSYSQEYVRVPRDALVQCLGKSTLARAGIQVLSTPLEPEWEGHITLEFANTTSLPVRLYAHEGAVQLIFHKQEVSCHTSYKDRKGKYNHQKADIVLPKV